MTQKKMTLGYLLRTFPQLSQTFVNNEIIHLVQQGHGVVTAALARPGEGIAASLAPLSSRTLYWLDIDKSRLVSILKANVVLFLKFFSAYLRLLKEHLSSPGIFLKKVFLAHYFYAAGVSHIHTHFAWEQVAYLRFIKRLTGISFSVTLHAADIYSEVRCMAEAAKEAAFLITISRHNKGYLVHEVGVDPWKLHVVHCGVERKILSGSTGFFSDTDENRVPVILSAGRMTEKKGFDLFIAALKLLHDRGISFEAKIIGDGPLMPDIKRRIETSALKGQVELPGALPHEAVLTAIHNCCLFVLACRRAENGDIDGIPVVLMEAMAAAKPVVSTSLSGIPELVQPGTGLLVPPESPEKLADAMAALLKDREEAGKMGQKGQQVVAHSFSIQGQVERLVTLIQARR